MEIDENNSLPKLGLTPIQEFYSGTNVFVTGATGFLGQVLIEKLLRSCPTISKIYLLLRPKKDKDIDARLQKILGDVLFDKLRRQNPKFANKIVPIAGDCSLPNLGLTSKDTNLLINNVNIVFHVAATVRFDEPIKVATNINVKAVRDLSRIVRQMKDLKVFMHVSTAYSNCPRKMIEEKVYEPPISGSELIELTETSTDENLKEITPKLIGKWPNTYSFTKCVAEDIVKTETTGLPVGIFRPAIVTSTANEPIVAWVNNFYGPSGFIAGCGTGLMRILPIDVNKDACLVPVDMCMNSMIAAAWEVHNEHQKAIAEKRHEPIAVYNYVSTNDNPITWGKFVKESFNCGLSVIPLTAVWWPSITLIKNFWLYIVCVILFHFVPALIVDGLLLCTGKKPKMVKAYKKIYVFCDAISFFATSEWKFESARVQKLNKKMSTEDKTLFFSDMKMMNWDVYIVNIVRGVRVYMVHEPMDTVEEGQRRIVKYYYAHQIIKGVLFGLLLSIFWRLLSCVI